MNSQGKLSPALAKASPPSASASIADWVAWLLNAAAAFESASEASRVYSGSQPADMWWYAETRNLVLALLALVRDHLPWLMPEYKPLRDVPEYAINAKAETFSVEAAAEFAETLERKLVHAAEASKPGSAPPLAAKLSAALPGAARNLHLFAAGLRNIAQKSEEIAENTEFGFLVDPGRQVLSIGYDVRGRKVHQACYDMLASEARVATFLAIARGEMPHQSWFKLARDYTFAFGTHVIISWTATMFEYLMPSLWMRSYPHTLVARNLSRGRLCAARLRSRGGNSVGNLGIGKCSTENDRGDYGYHAYGHSPRSRCSGKLNQPARWFLRTPRSWRWGSIPWRPSAISAIWLQSDGWVRTGLLRGRGLSPPKSHNGECSCASGWFRHRSLQGMSLLAIVNTLCDDIVQQWFDANPLVQSAELLLHEPPTSMADLKAMMKDFANIPPKAS